MKLVVGLGNPGKKYASTRHNIGFRVVDHIAEKERVSFVRDFRARARRCTVRMAEGPVELQKPQTYMNRSGYSVASKMRRSGLSIDDLIVIVDDMDLEIGQVRIRPGGSSGGHNGLKSIEMAIGSREFTRLRVGVGRADENGHAIAHVLGPFSKQEEKVMSRVVELAADALEVIVAEGTEKAMNQFNGMRIGGSEQHEV